MTFRCLLAIALLLPGCLSTSGTSLPKWVDAPASHPRCDRREALCAVGIASGSGQAARELAQQRALEQIVSSVLVSVQSTIDLDSTSRRSNDDIFWTDEVRERIRVSSQQEDLPGLEVVERWVHPTRREVYVLVKVPRELLLDRWMPRVGQALAEAETYLLTADELSMHSPGRAIHNTLEAYRVVAGAYGDAIKSKVVARESRQRGQADQSFARTSQLMAETSARLAQLIGGVRLVKLAGDGQAGVVRGSLPQALRVRLEYQDLKGEVQPLQDVPLRFASRIEGAADVLTDSSTTDAAGEASCRVVNLGPTGLANNEILVQPGFSTVAPDLADKHVPAASFVYHLPTAAGTTVVLAVREIYEGSQLSPSVLQGELASHLSGFGFSVRGQEPSASMPSIDLETSTDPQALRQALGPDADVLLRGRAEARHSSLENQLHWFRAYAQLELVNIDSGRVTALSTEEVKDAHREHSQSGAIRALKLLRGPLFAELERTLVADFVPSSSLEP